MRAFVLLLVAISFLAARGTSAEDAKPMAADEPTKALEGVNAAARAIYASARTKLLDEAGPVVLFDGDTMVFRYGSVRKVTKVTPALYTDVKSTSHLALALHALTVTAGDKEFPDRLVFDLKAYRELVRVARAAIRKRELDKPLADRQDHLLRLCDECAEAMLRDGKGDPKQAVSHLRRLRPLIDENGLDVSKAMIAALHKEMTALRGRLSPAAWKSLTVIVQGPQMPRKDNLAVQYFARLFGEAGEGKRVVYAEGLFEEAAAHRLLGTHLLDRRIGRDIWNDDTFMFRDLLAAPAKVALDELFGKKE